MPTGKKPRNERAGGGRPFGAGLGSDFSPLGRRIIIGPAKDQVKLKRRRVKPDDKGALGAKSQPEE
jgi:hypothetical protein